MSNFQREHLWQILFAVVCFGALALGHYRPQYADASQLVLLVFGGSLVHLGLLSESAVRAAPMPARLPPELVKLTESLLSKAFPPVDPPSPPPPAS